MIAVQLNKRDFEYDVHSLIRAFYPGMEVSIYYQGDEQVPRAEWKICIFYKEEEIEITFCDGKENEILCKKVDVEYYANRMQTKNVLKRLLYDMLLEHTGKELPWGTLTGIRPIKLPMALLEDGKKESEVAEYMRTTYYCNAEKADLSVAIAKREKQILSTIDYANGYSLYIGIPFCPSICLYCSFSSSPLAVWKEKVDLYLDALCKEIIYSSSEYKNKTLDTVYIGGGTPTTLEPRQLDRLLCQMEQSFDLSSVQEFTVEAGRPDSITKEKLEVLKHHGITRISINPQTMNQQTLDFIGRRHTVKETKTAFYMAREMGFDNINMDLIIGLPGETRKEVEHTMKEVSYLNPDSVTVHSLAVKRAARLHMFQDEYKEMTFVNNQEIMALAADYAKTLNMAPYYLYRQKNMAGNFENVGYARNGKEGIYNILIMEEKQSILALGAGSSTKLVQKNQVNRIENVKDIKSYLERIDEMIERKRQGFIKYGK